MKRILDFKLPVLRRGHAIGLVAALGTALISLQVAFAQTSTDTALAQTPLFVSESYPPLNMLVMGRDHKLYYEAYNDASDLDGDGVIDVGYKPDKIDYYGNFNNNACYSYGDGKFTPVAAATGAKKKQCAGGTRWSGDFLNYLTTSRMDAIRRVLYGGMRVVDTAGSTGTPASTVLQAAYIPRDAHTWGKSYDPVRDLAVYNISDYAPLAQPVANTRHLFAVTTLGESADIVPQLRVLNDSTFQVWDWVSKEGQAGQSTCLGGVACETPAKSSYQIVPASSYQGLTITTWKSSGSNPANLAAMEAYFLATKLLTSRCGSGTISLIDTSGSGNNPFSGNGCTSDNYITEITGTINIPKAGTYTFAVDGDDAVDVTIDGSTLGRYGPNGSNRTEANLANFKRDFVFATAGWKTLRFRHAEASGGDNWGLFLKIDQTVSRITDHNIRVEACSSSNADLREASCKLYANNGGTAIYKPTGLLHDFGENEKMYFGLLTGSYQKNIAGGTLRRNMSSFADEVNLQTGQFKSDVNGVVANINRLRVIGFNGNTYADCGWITNGSISSKTDPSICAMWGNPVAEMMFETMRYFGGAAAAHPTFDYGSDTSKDKTLGLAKPAWVSPYTSKASGGGGYQRCAKPVMTVLSDINPSYDYKLPGSRFVSSMSAESTVLSGFNGSTEVDAIGVAEGIHGKDFFIGQSTGDATSAGNANAAPSVKRVDALSRVRGLSPQEPSKEGTYNSAGVARFAANNAIFGAGTDTVKNGISTYAVAIASPLPEIRFPAGSGRFVTIAPFAKSVTGSSINAASFAPTDQIVDYYVDRIANTGTADADPNVNAGRPYAEFRINYEDVEQGADHDMDAIARYVVSLEADGKVKIDMVSEYAAGSIGQHMGYVISGTTQDGMYLEVRDKDTASVYYALNTPPGREPGYCASRSTDAECATLGLSASRSFTVSNSASASFLKDPLWYAAKYGMPGRLPSSVTGDPDNYFLVTNATTLKAQMTKAFNNIAQTNTSVTAVSVDAPQATLTEGASVFRTRFGADGWDGDVIRDNLTEVVGAGLSYVRQWSAAEQLAARTAPRKILYAGAGVGSARPVLRPFTFAAIGQQTADAAWLTALNLNPTTQLVDNKAEQRISFLRGESHALRVRKTLANGSPNVLGDIVNSTLVRVKGARYIATAADALEGSTSRYADFVSSQATKPEMIYVGANDGMLHAFRASDGVEEFAFIPSALRGTLNQLTASDYGAKGGLPHRYFVDGTPTSADVFFGGAWHKVLIGSLGAGGRQVFALDITDPTNPSLLWEFGAQQQANMGHSLAQPTIARLDDPATGKGKWVALVPNGYQGANSSAGGASLSVLDVSNGSVLKQFDLAGGMTAAELTASLPLGNGLSRVTAVDGNRDGKTEVAYAGDLLGNLWRFDLKGADTSRWKVQKFYTAKDASGKRQPITMAPYVVEHPTHKGDLVIFGTGRMLTASDKGDTQKQSIYGLWDRYNGPNAAAAVDPLPTLTKGRSDLQQQTFSELTVASVDTGNFALSANAVGWYATSTGGTAEPAVQTWGWYVDLPKTGEKMVYDMTLYGLGLFMSSVATSDDPCTAGLSGMRYAIDPNTGGRTRYVPFDINNDGAFNAAGDSIGGLMVSGRKTGAAGQQTISRGMDHDPTGNRLNVNPGVEVGRQSWRRQPAN
jgi:type IV pilus assembly protein PilY1